MDISEAAEDKQSCHIYKCNKTDALSISSEFGSNASRQVFWLVASCQPLPILRRTVDMAGRWSACFIKQGATYSCGDSSGFTPESLLKNYFQIINEKMLRTEMRIQRCP
jgi:hypothetical protein